MRKLVELDPVSKRFMEVDTKRLKREAKILKEYILSAPAEEERQLRYRSEILPIVEAALNGTLELPYRGYMPYVWEGGEGLLPPHYRKLEANFLVVAKGSHIRVPEIVMQDGKEYAWMEFED